MEQNGAQVNMTAHDSGQQDPKDAKKPEKLTKKEKTIYGSIAIICIIGIVLLLTLVILPRGAEKYRRTGSYDGNILDFSECNFRDPDWIYGVMGSSIELYAMQLQQNTTFVYMEDWGRLSCSYTTQAAASVMKDFYMGALDNAEYTNVMDDRLIKINGTYKGMAVEVVNYATDFADTYEITMDIDASAIDYIRKNTDDLFAGGTLEGAPEIQGFMRGEPLGGSVTYSHDELNTLVLADIPVASRIYEFDGDAAAFEAMIEEAKTLFGESFLETEAGWYGDYNGYRVFLGMNGQGADVRAVVNAQKLPAE